MKNLKSGLEMAQNAARLSWKAEKVDARLHHIMLDIHHACVNYGGEGKQTNYIQGANIAGFVKVADATVIIFNFSESSEFFSRKSSFINHSTT